MSLFFDALLDIDDLTARHGSGSHSPIPRLTTSPLRFPPSSCLNHRRKQGSSHMQTYTFVFDQPDNEDMDQ
ncbi:hypothetical protein [Streptomyces sp. NPDC001401]|uniref:hypothetical protein n=1 Tax=Streptomyces sp. NPDC001401 TaxID=3364570 RepID=UPI003679B22D